MVIMFISIVKIVKIHLDHSEVVAMVMVLPEGVQDQ
jgi:hypothetical protein